MKLIFIYGPPAAGKLTIAKLLSERTGFPLFHNHLIVDAVHAVFPFGSPSFVRLREMFWLETIKSACDESRSLIFTYQPEMSVSPDFAERVKELVSQSGGQILFVKLTLTLEEQLKRIANSDRTKFGKLTDPELLKQLHLQFQSCEDAMPSPNISIDTALASAVASADRIAQGL